jgi:hypothetical protein
MAHVAVPGGVIAYRTELRRKGGIYAFGVPMTTGLSTVVIGVALSLGMWFGLGQWAAHRATKRPVADWRDWWSVMWPLALAMSVGGFAGFAMFALSVL